MPRWLVIGSVGFWILMTGLLVRKDLLPDDPADAPAGYAAVVAAEGLRTASRMGIFVRGRRVGESDLLVDPRKDGTVILNHSTRVSLPEAGFANLASHGVFILDRNSRLDSVHFRVLVSDRQVAVVRGRVDKGMLKAAIRLGDNDTTLQNIPLPEGGVVGHDLDPFLPMKNLAVGRTWTVSLFSPMTLRFEKARVRVDRREPLAWQGRTIRAFVATMTAAGAPRFTAWYDEAGTPLKMEGPFGITLVREEMETP